MQPCYYIVAICFLYFNSFTCCFVLCSICKDYIPIHKERVCIVRNAAVRYVRNIISLCINDSIILDKNVSIMNISDISIFCV